jgi:hypothetical protein
MYKPQPQDSVLPDHLFSSMDDLAMAAAQEVAAAERQAVAVAAAKAAAAQAAGGAGAAAPAPAQLNLCSMRASDPADVAPSPKRQKLHVDPWLSLAARDAHKAALQRLELQSELCELLLKLPYPIAAYVGHLEEAAPDGNAVLKDAVAAVSAATKANGKRDEAKLSRILQLMRWCNLALPMLVQVREQATDELQRPDERGSHTAAAAKLKASHNTLVDAKDELAAAGFPEQGEAKPHCISAIEDEMNYVEGTLITYRR